MTLLQKGLCCCPVVWCIYLVKMKRSKSIKPPLNSQFGKLEQYKYSSYSQVPVFFDLGTGDGDNIRPS